METSAIAAVCEGRHCPWSVFRAISDRADDGSSDTAVFGLAGPDGRPILLPFALPPQQAVASPGVWRGWLAA